EADLQRALVAREVVVFYQPIVDLCSGAIVGCEALARWRHPTRGLLNPASFIPFAEESDLINRIDSLVLSSACTQTRAWQSAHPEASSLAISVNVSSRRLIESSLAHDVARALEDAGLDPSSLILEITESAMMRDTEIAARNIGEVRDLGVRIALDDFGTGYSSLSYLERFPIDIIKIDQTFVETVRPGGTPGALAPAIVQLARTLGHATIAEGIEHADQAVALRAMGCELGQGFFLAVPQEADDIEEMLRSERPVPVPGPAVAVS
ncbi:MAG: putative bifunctional diguanylate cyclase/phosphodiesterase, partial [Acidimicrobiales bacterium]